MQYSSKSGGEYHKTTLCPGISAGMFQYCNAYFEQAELPVLYTSSCITLGLENLPAASAGTYSAHVRKIGLACSEKTDGSRVLLCMLAACMDHD